MVTLPASSITFVTAFLKSAKLWIKSAFACGTPLRRSFKIFLSNFYLYYCRVYHQYFLRKVESRRNLIIPWNSSTWQEQVPRLFKIWNSIRLICIICISLKYWVFTWFENKSAVCIFLQSVLKEIPYKDKRICSRADQKMPILRRKNKCILELVIQFEK